MSHTICAFLHSFSVLISRQELSQEPPGSCEVVAVGAALCALVVVEVSGSGSGSGSDVDSNERTVVVLVLEGPLEPDASVDVVVGASVTLGV